MGGDLAPAAQVAGALAAVRLGIPVVLVGDEATLTQRIEAERRRRPWRSLALLCVEHAGDSLGMDEPAGTVRSRPECSVRRTIQLVKEGRAAAAVSCGQTGATLVGTILDLGTLPGVKRPAIATRLPRRDGGSLVLVDAGASVDCKPELLVSFAMLGAAYVRASGVRSPRIGLLSNGEEDGKGNQQVRATLPLLRELDLDVVGNVEPSAAMAGACDVLVCDGFVGNVLLKAAEGAVSTVVALLREEIGRRPTGVLGAFLLRGAFERFRKRVQWDAIGGALLLGAEGVVVVGHGRADAGAVCAAIQTADRYARSGLVDAMR